MVAGKHGGLYFDCANRHADQGIADLPPLAVFPHNAALPVLNVIKIRHGFLKRVQYLYTTRLPVFALEDHDKVVTADVADKVDLVDDSIAQHPAGKLDQFISASETVCIIERLEVIEIAIAGPESNT